MVIESKEKIIVIGELFRNSLKDFIFLVDPTNK